jgi:hypothetical protein
MTERIDLERILRLLAEDRDLLDRLVDGGFLPSDPAELTIAHAETARVVGTLVHELEVNWEGAEVILHMRSELVETRQRVVALYSLLRERLPDEEHE